MEAAAAQMRQEGLLKEPSPEDYLPEHQVTIRVGFAYLEGWIKLWGEELETHFGNAFSAAKSIADEDETCARALFLRWFYRGLTADSDTLTNISEAATPAVRVGITVRHYQPKFVESDIAEMVRAAIAADDAHEERVEALDT